MRNRCFNLLLLFLSAASSCLCANDTLFIKEAQTPILLERNDNVLFYIRIDAQKSKVLNELKLTFDKETEMHNIHSVSLYYSGTERRQRAGQTFFKPVEYIPRNTGNTLSANTSYSILKDSVLSPNAELSLRIDQPLFPGINYFWVSIRMHRDTSLDCKVSAKISEAIADNKTLPIRLVSPPGISHRMGIGLRHAGNDGANSYRIPGLATSTQGTLLGVYDIRYNSSADLQEFIDIGLSRSIDKGQTWEPMRVPISFGEYNGLPKAQNGVGDPAILVDEQTGTIWIMAVWTHGMGNGRAWTNSGQGMEMKHTGQLILAKSNDDGKTWSPPINITNQLKNPSWYFLLQGPGKGISMENGTLVFPVQYIDSTRVPNAGIVYSKDHGTTWKMHQHAKTNTTEAQVVETEPGVLMLNMRDNRGGSRSIATTKDDGKTWIEHPSSRKALQEPVCMASIIKVKAKDNMLNKDILLFSNPNTSKGRNHITIKASLDNGLSWLPEHELLLDEEEGWGYSCLSMIDKETLGILYEGSTAHLVFQRVKLNDIVKTYKRKTSLLTE